MGADGREWTVRRHWAPRIGHETLWGRIVKRFRSPKRRLRDAAGRVDAADGALMGMQDLVALIVILVGAALFVLIGLPLLLAVFDVILLVLLAVLGVLGRVLLRRPWTVEACPQGDGGGREWRVVGWRDSARLVDSLARRLQSGEPLPPAGWTQG